MQISLDQQVALITGASSGIGAGAAKALAAAGATVVINYHSQAEPAEELARQINAEGGRAIAIGADVSKEEDVERLFAQTLEAFGSLDILVANSGMQKDAKAVDMTLADWNQVIGVNLTGQFLCARAALRIFNRQGIREGVSRAAGKIIHMSSVHQRIPWAGHVNYAASKGGVDMLMQTLAQEVSHQRIRINGIAPGAIRTDINRDANEEQLLKLIPYGRVGEVEDIANAVVFLASDASDYIVGTTLFIDGGMSLYPEFRGNG
ncbi:MULTISPECIES: glucose 1-dehydrogenase [unclassified Pseudomonas]|uniref:glucose 1-dehydrogenase n=1 Tax=unclassified Pseudomonas TaxID=196821 RepID=UPI000C86D8EF|nr:MULTISPECIES: glucose 1-dehydrogenase [unclassified Pseudomonas]MBU0522923.1 glucose 1-dehydrogenase [Gammaproteobacteria bacterium]MBU0817792.1 glucose 1-dehydrogenase [Gammaproteobacteria bacterium]MBU0843633.1 glucose 1-dehydrogenase [Gammaproteobacteria bacterium]MBU1844016.1 glucose 1-dehydrogenase [Gammaproteobacteria bacterium]PMV82931.1 sugar dehydrogenase [Pseudomonas sp. GW101-1A09]